MPSEVWKYFDEFKGGAKCKLCGTIRNRKDKSTSTFWQHLKKIHQISQLKTPYSKTEEEFIEVKVKFFFIVCIFLVYPKRGCRRSASITLVNFKINNIFVKI